MGNTLSAHHETPHEVDLGPKGVIPGSSMTKRPVDTRVCRMHCPPWHDGSPFDASFFRPVCPQAEVSHGVKNDTGPAVYSEDCLCLNTWTPVDDHGKKWPVELGMDPAEMVSTGKLQAIVIGIGYRLNVFGFLAGDALLEESAGEKAGNSGLWDQRWAMEWVYENIAAFNGDIGNITLGGRSAGAYGVLVQVLHDFRRESQLFHRFYLISNAIPAQPKAMADVNLQFEELCEYFQIPASLSGPEKVDRLRGVSSADLIKALPHLQHHTSRPVTDDRFIFGGFTEYHRSGAFADSPEPNLESLRLPVSNYYALETTDRIAYRLSFITDTVAPHSFGVAHAMDKPLAFVQDEEYEYSTRAIDDIRVVTPDAKIETQHDARWTDLVRLGEVFANDVEEVRSPEFDKVAAWLCTSVQPYLGKTVRGANENKLVSRFISRIMYS
ncbi:hypothetical protein N7492_004962 [Penicillium capsulatum]|uniref:Carboxylesterase type B domain-containing protein n=1 Tax=Penicillium capsulatum TaxID=69766 RepID=A0A9W9IAT1_9EURO|nr:hypothetical protein N7492_004962 [Penicillium capsulatum]KAJ6135930.1 hypothetical protein N7512_001090 [Penicillium capsulatum]